MSSLVTPTLGTLWWLSFWTALGLCLGSFLNVVIFRLPRDKSLTNPLWSACPSCRSRIAWYDNVPLLSFVLLRGRCRHCGVPISTSYPVIEASMAIIVLMLIDAFFIGEVRTGLRDTSFGLTDHLAHDWPIFVAHVVLFACLLPMSAIDLERYWVDIRFTNFATVVGFVGHALWTPAHSAQWTRPGETLAVVSLLGVIALAVTWIIKQSQSHVALDHLGEPECMSEPPSPSTSQAARRPPPSLASGSRAAGWIASLLLAAMFTLLVVDETTTLELRHTGRALVPLLMFFGLVVWESTIRRPADQQIVEAIDEERHGARAMVLRELLILLPALFVGGIGLCFMLASDHWSRYASGAMHSEIHVSSITLLRNWSPVWGLATAASGYFVAGALGWAVRIVFTLIFGKEAFGVGDIHLMAAAGCIAGWPIAVVGFFLACLLALGGWLFTLPFKRSSALPLGPWLSLSFLMVVVFYDTIRAWPQFNNAIETARFLWG